MLNFALDITLATVAASMVLCFLRLSAGPSLPDRILALDTLGINAIAFLVVFGMREHSSVYFDAALLIATMGFAGTIAFAKYLLRGDIIQ